jgi:energy-converting hydrogenase Eha subunit C
MTIFVIMLCLSVPALACSIASFLQRGPVLSALSMVFLLQSGVVVAMLQPDFLCNSGAVSPLKSIIFAICSAARS